jgi:hypothetical protein
MSTRGYTLVEVMLATGSFSLVMAGSLGVYMACYRSWNAMNVSMQAARQSSLVFQRMVYGPYGSNGLRSAISTNVVAVSDSNKWSVTYSAAGGGRYQFAYVKTNATVVYTDLTCGTTNAPSKVIGAGIVASSITSQTATGLSVSVSAVAANWQGRATNVLTSYIHYRN